MLPISMESTFICGCRVVVTAAEAPFVQLETSMGKIIVELYWKHAPQTCQNFASLAAVRTPTHFPGLLQILAPTTRRMRSFLCVSMERHRQEAPVPKLLDCACAAMQTTRF
jgi:hypothetical protein